MRGKIWKKCITLTAVAGVMVGQIGAMPVWAEEGQLIEEEMESPEEIREPEVTEITAEETVDAVIESEASDIDEEVTEQASGITWTVDGDTMVITGEGEFEQAGIAIHMGEPKHVRFENCKVQGSMRGAFQNLAGFSSLESVDLSGLDTSQVTDMSLMFYGCYNVSSLDVSGFDTSQVTDMSSMFSGCSVLSSLDVSGFDTSQVTNMSSMFSGCSNLISLDVSGFNTSQVTNMSSMFSGCSVLSSLDVSTFDTSQIKDMGAMFADCRNISSLDVSRFNTSQVTNMSLMFSGCCNISSLDVSGFDTSQVTDMSGMFKECSSLTSLNTSSFDTSQVTSMWHMFANCSSLTSLDLSSFDTSQITEMGAMFSDCSSLLDLNVSSFDTSQVTSMSYMFSGCSSLADLNLSNFDTSQVTLMDYMFNNCRGLISLKVSSFDTSQVTTMDAMFWKCHSLINLDVSGFDTSQVTGMSDMFSECFSLTSLDLSSFDTSRVTGMGWMFEGCSSLTSLDLSGFDTRSVLGMDGMFCGCSSLANLDVSGFDTSRVTAMAAMFRDCSSLERLDLSNFDMSNVTKTSSDDGGMFTNCHPQEIGVPKALHADCTVALDGTYRNPAGVQTNVLSADFLSTVLTLVEDKPEPVKFAVVGTIGGRNVTFSTDTEDAVIYYSSKTSNLTTEDTCVQNGGTVLFENFYGTIYARAYVDGQWGNVSRLILKIPVVNKPVITNNNGVVTIKTSTPNSMIYYTTDGSTPSPTNGKRLTNSAGSFTVPANCTVRAIAVRSCFTNSEVVSAAVTVKKLGAPSFAVKGVIGGRAVTFNSTETQGEIYYSFTTSNITTSYSHVKPGETIVFGNYYGTLYAKSYVNGQWSNISRLILKIPVVNKPTITDVGNGKVKITTTTPNCTIYYTTDGSIPAPPHGTRIDSSSSVITVESGTTVKAIAVRSCFTNSEVTTYRK